MTLADTPSEPHSLPASREWQHWQQGYGVILHNSATRDAVAGFLAGRQAAGGDARQTADLLRLFAAADRLASAAMWLVVHMTYANRVYLDGRPLQRHEFKASPQGHTGGALNMVPAYVGYLLANALTGHTRSWLMGQGHCVAAIEAVNAIVGNLSAAQQGRYGLSDTGLTRLAQDFYSYAVHPDGSPAVPLGSHVNAHTAGGISEGGYLGFAEVQYVHMPLPGESLAVFLSDGAFEEQRGGDWAARWWRARDCGTVMPVMILNGRRIEQRTSIVQQGGVQWLHDHLALNGFAPFELDGHDPAAYACALIAMEQKQQAWQAASQALDYPLPLPFGIAPCVKGYGFPGAGLNRAHNLPLPGNPSSDPESLRLFQEGAARLHVPESVLQEGVAQLCRHQEQHRPRESHHALAVRSVPTPTLPTPDSHQPGAIVSPMQAIDDYFVRLVQANPALRVRVGNPDELASNRMGGTLATLKHRVNRPEFHEAEDVHGRVITALNEEAVIGAALGNKGGLNLAVSYEAFALKMLGALRQDILFARNQRLAGHSPEWLGVPLLLTSHTWENGKNEQSHQDPGLAELLLGEMSDTSRVFFPVDAASSVACLQEVYRSHGVIGSLVIPKQELPCLLTGEQAAQACATGAIDLADPGENSRVQLVAVGAYQAIEAMKAAQHLKQEGIACRVTCIIEPGRFRHARDSLEAGCVADESVIDVLFPPATPRVLICHTRPEPMLGVLRRLDGGPRATQALGYINRGGTLDTNGMLLANRCTSAHIAEAARGLLADAA